MIVDFRLSLNLLKTLRSFQSGTTMVPAQVKLLDKIVKLSY